MMQVVHRRCPPAGCSYNVTSSCGGVNASAGSAMRTGSLQRATRMFRATTQLSVSHGRIRRRRMVCRGNTRIRAGLGNLVESTLPAVLLTSGRNAWIISGVSVSNQTLPLLMGQAGKGKGRLSSDSDDESDGNDQLLWAVSGVVSAIPFVNWLSWVNLAIQTGERRFYALGFLYALPYLAEGLDIKGITVFSVLACIAHIQIERISAADPLDEPLLPLPKEARIEPKGQQKSLVDRILEVAPLAQRDARGDRDAGREAAVGAGAGGGEEESDVDPASQLARAAGFAVGGLKARLTQMRADFEQARVQAELEQTAQQEAENLRLLEERARDELKEWDKRYGLRNLQRDTLIEIARANGIKGPLTRMRKQDLIELLEGPEGIMGGSASADAGATTRGGGVGKPP